MLSLLPVIVPPPGRSIGGVDLLIWIRSPGKAEEDDEEDEEIEEEDEEDDDEAIEDEGEEDDEVVRLAELEEDESDEGPENGVVPPELGVMVRDI